ncbi:MAG: NAD-dependent epimerase/dehydratase family protein [Geminicoccaceae bacterium]|nr:NAD-dependent epimerase/dehydratase family protein [Geminicoccaceae bacterium]
MGKRVLITGGAGFIGRHVAKALLARGHEVRVLDSLVEQVHGSTQADTHWPEVEVQIGDVRDGEAVGRALIGVDAVVHLAAEVGVGQSMYEIERYVGVNEWGTAVLFQKLSERPVELVITASSMSIYGEGLYRTQDGAEVADAVRPAGSMARGWDPGDEAGRPLLPVATPERKTPSLASVYALNKYAQERLTHIVADAYGMQGITLRLFNVYGSGQALSNPYTGVLAIFAARLLNGKQPMVFEDGLQRRDFVHVSDVARAFASALEAPSAAGGTFNIGSGEDVTIAQVAERLAGAMGRPDLPPRITGRARAGDIRHCFADITRAHAALDYAPRVAFDDGLAEVVDWVARQKAVDRVDTARLELERRGLVA